MFTAVSLSILWLNTREEGGDTRAVTPKTAKQEAAEPRPSEDVSEADAGKQATVAETAGEAPVEGAESVPAAVSAGDAPQANDAGTHLALGMQYYKNDDLQKALWHLQEALRIEPDNRVARDMMAKVSREARVEEGFTNKEGSHFNVRYEGGENAVAGHTVAIILEEAYQKVGSDLGFYPEDSITAVLYTAEQFRDVTRAPSWSGAIYDGKIRIPVGGVRERTDLLEKVIFHEYSHAVIHKMGGGKVPTWLNEGIAQYEEGPAREEIFRHLASAQNMVPLNYLEGSFMGLTQEQAVIAYAEGLSAVKYIMDEYGMGMLGRLINSYKEGKGSEAAIRDTFQMTYREFQDSWIRNLKRRYGFIERMGMLPA